MTLPLSAISFADVNVELGRAANRPLSLNDSAVFALKGVTATPISMSELRGKSRFTPYGTLIWSGVCKGTTYGNYRANGSGGTYFEVLEYNSIRCGWKPPEQAGPSYPERGTAASEPYCVGRDLYADFHDGAGGIYQAIVQSNSSSCQPSEQG